MKNLDKDPEGGTDRYHNNQEQENQSETSHRKSPLLSGPWRPYRRPRAVVKEWLLRIRCCLGAVCGMEWYGYATQGILMAFLSFLMDITVTKLLRAHRWLYVKMEGNSLLQFFCWTLYPSCLCAVASSFSHNICPFSTGSGIPEVRTMLAGIEMPHYLSLTHMFAKFLGLICTLAAGSTVFLGKVGPFVHLSTMVGAYLSNLCVLIQDNKKEKVAGEMLVVAAAVGVASCFGAPISGVLFSVEVTCSHYALKHYFPCFFAAACGALTFRLFSVWSGDEETLQVLFKTNFPASLPFYPSEILLFGFLGLLCGAVSCCYLFCYQRILQFTKTNPVFIKMLTTEKGLYSGMVVFLIALVTFPHFAGQYLASKYTTKQLLTALLESRQWTSQSHNASVQLESMPFFEWGSSGIPVCLSLAFFLLIKMCILVLACTLPVPAGYFMPVFVCGAALGRLFGEGVAAVVYTGITSDQDWTPINPAGYALAGAAALSGAVTHTLSPALLAIELTGQFSHTLPVLLATLLANALARSGHRPSFYDILSISKKLPHLPSLKKACKSTQQGAAPVGMMQHTLPTSGLLFIVVVCSCFCLGTNTIPSTPVGGLLGGKPVQLQKAAGPTEVQEAVNTSSETQVPVVDSHETQILLGFVFRSELLMFLRHSKTETVEKNLDDVCCIHPCSVLLSLSNTVQEVLGILSLVGDQTLFVTEKGRLVGVITWLEMKKILEDLAKEI